MSKDYMNFEELQQDQPIIAKELLDEVGPGEWQKDALYVYDDAEQYAKHELTDGWYAGSGFDFDETYHGAPNPLDYIDLKAFASDLVATWDPSCQYETSTGAIVQTGYGW